MVVKTTRSADTVGASAWDAKQLRTMDMTRRSAGGARKTYVWSAGNWVVTYAHRDSGALHVA